jgi:hypothetical protein
MRGWPESKTQIPPNATPYFAMKDELVLQMV